MRCLLEPANCGPSDRSCQESTRHGLDAGSFGRSTNSLKARTTIAMRPRGLLPVVVLVAAAVIRTSGAETVGPDKPRLQPVVGLDVKHDLSAPLYLATPKRDADVESSTHEPLLLPKARHRSAVPAVAPVIEADDDARGGPAAVSSLMPPR